MALPFWLEVIVIGINLLLAVSGSDLVCSLGRALLPTCFPQASLSEHAISGRRARAMTRNRGSPRRSEAAWRSSIRGASSRCW